MLEWCRRCGLKLDDLDRLNAIHIAGTKGKGSTSAFISSILTKYADGGDDKAPTKVGLYTSPHLRFVRERIQINNAPISEQDFADSFFQIWDRLQESAKTDPIPEDQPQTPVYFQFLTILAFHTYLKQGVDTAIIECGIGGEYDSTNVLKHPTTTGITALGIDHVMMLGDTVESIAWHKAGIMKPGAPIYTIEQPGNANAVLKQRAEERSTELHVVSQSPEIANGSITLGLAGEFQKSNASLAVAIAGSHLRALGHTDIDTASKLPEKFVRGLETVRFDGRCETRREPGIVWHIDGAHTIESMEVACTWFASCVNNAQDRKSETRPRPRILLFNQQSRSGEPLLKKLHEVIADKTGGESLFTHAIFCSNLTFESTGYRPDLVSINANSAEVNSLEVQQKLAKAWAEIDPSTEITVVRSIEGAIALARKIVTEAACKQDVRVFTVGSVHLIGGVLEVLESDGVASG